MKKTAPMTIEIITTAFSEVILLQPKVHGDDRGFFMETYHEEKYHQAGIHERFVQDNYSRSSRNTLRGLHYQLRYGQGKLVGVLHGEVFDVAVDIRQGSEHFGKWFGCRLSAANKRQLYIPAGFAHGFLVLSDTADFYYKCTQLYHPEDEYGIHWSDPHVAISWPLNGAPLVSEKDRVLPNLNNTTSEFLPPYLKSPLPD